MVQRFSQVILTRRLRAAAREQVTHRMSDGRAAGSTRPSRPSYLILSETLYPFHSQVLPLSGEKAWLQTGRSLSRASQRNIMMIGRPLKVSRAKKCPTPFWNEPMTGGSRTPTLLATQYRLQSLVFGLK